MGTITPHFGVRGFGHKYHGFSIDRAKTSPGLGKAEEGVIKMVTIRKKHVHEPAPHLFTARACTICDNTRDVYEHPILCRNLR
jgi:hypothetical protein